MTHYNVDYSKTNDRDAGDRDAVWDLLEWCNAKQWEILVQTAQSAKTIKDVQVLNFQMSFVGVTGRPFMALCRCFCLDALKLWWHNPEDPPPVNATMDDNGFVTYS